MRIGVVELEIRRPETNLRAARQALEACATEGCRLVLFPAYLGNVLSEEGMEVFVRLRRGEPARATFAACEELLSRWAREAGVYLVGGSVLVPAGSEASPGYVNLCPAFSPSGEVILRQLQTHADAGERERGLVTGHELGRFSAEELVVGPVVGTDVMVPEVSRIHSLLGATLLVVPNAVPGYPPWIQLAGLWQEVQQNQVFGAEACLVGELGGLSFRGRTAVFGPCEMTPGKSGFLAGFSSFYRDLTLRYMGEETPPELREPWDVAPGRGTALAGEGYRALVVEVDPAELRATWEEYDIFGELNLGLYCRHLPEVYGGGER